MRSRKDKPDCIEIRLRPHGGIPAVLTVPRPAPGYDRLPKRRWLFVPMWGVPRSFSMRLGGWSASSTAWSSSIFPGAMASGR